MEEKIEEAINYANNSNRLENNELKEKEKEVIKEQISNLNNDKIFLKTILNLTKNEREEKSKENGKTR